MRCKETRYGSPLGLSLNLVNALDHVGTGSMWHQSKFNRPPPEAWWQWWQDSFCSCITTRIDISTSTWTISQVLDKNCSWFRGFGSFFIMAKAVFRPYSFCACKTKTTKQQISLFRGRQNPSKHNPGAFTLIRSKVSMWSKIPTSNICCKVMPSCSQRLLQCHESSMPLDGFSFYNPSKAAKRTSISKSNRSSSKRSAKWRGSKAFQWPKFDWKAGKKPSKATKSDEYKRC